MNRKKKIILFSKIVIASYQKMKILDLICTRN